MRSIDGDALIDALRDYERRMREFPHEGQKYYITTRTVKKMIGQMPELTPTWANTWLVSKDGTEVECPRCGAIFDIKFKRARYCARCGKRMGIKEDEDGEVSGDE